MTVRYWLRCRWREEKDGVAWNEQSSAKSVHNLVIICFGEIKELRKSFQHKASSLPLWTRGEGICHLSPSLSPDLPEVTQQLKPVPVLTVTDGEVFVFTINNRSVSIAVDSIRITRTPSVLVTTSARLLLVSASFISSHVICDGE